MIDWFTLLNDLDRAGVSNAEVARRLTKLRGCKVYKSHIYAIKMGGDPTHSLGEMLIQLHRDVTGKSFVQNFVPEEGYKWPLVNV